MKTPPKPKSSIQKSGPYILWEPVKPNEDILNPIFSIKNLRFSAQRAGCGQTPCMLKLAGSVPSNFLKFCISSLSSEKILGN